MAKAIGRGGEGATKLVSISATGAASADEAKQAARTVASSLLVKTAIHGADPNWGGAGGLHSATVWTCDLSAEYVAINADYRT